MAEDTVKRNKRQAEWKKASKDRVELLLPKGYKQRLKELADTREQSTTEMIKELIDKELLK